MFLNINITIILLLSGNRDEQKKKYLCKTLDLIDWFTSTLRRQWIRAFRDNSISFCCFSFRRLKAISNERRKKPANMPLATRRKTPNILLIPSVVGDAVRSGQALSLEIDKNPQWNYIFTLDSSYSLMRIHFVSSLSMKPFSCNDRIECESGFIQTSFFRKAMP